MSFLVGPVSGVLVAGGVYYGFSTMIQTKTEQHRSDLHKLSRRLVDASANIPAPKPASERIAHRPFLSMLQSRWNTQLESVFQSATRWDRRVIEWGRRTLYGGDVDSTSKN